MRNPIGPNLAHLTNRIWRRKHLVFIAIILISLIITVSYTGSSISVFSPMSLFLNKQRQSSSIVHRERPSRHWITVAETKLVNEEEFNNVNPKIVIDQNREIGFDNHKLNDNPELSDSKSQVERYRALTRPYVPPLRMVHLDLKGAPPKISFLEEIFPLLAKAGANGLLLEFEDMFPFEGNLKYAAADNAYSKEDIKKINQLAKQYNFEVIPLIQSFGHMEYFLKLTKYRHLREADEFPQAICPSREEPFKLVTEIIDQVISQFPNSQWLHIGCDEVFQIGMCNLCKQKDHDELFLSHVHKVAKYVSDKHKVIPIIWDDMLRQFNPEMMKKYQFNKIGLEIMIWTYIDDIYRFLPYTGWMTYAEIFPNIWGASAFKGAFGETLTVPNIKMHLDNNIAWIGAMKEQASNFKNIRGLVLTGWQRYDHLATLAELLPSGLPSLILDLLTVSNGRYESKLLDKFDKLMNCGKNVYNTNDKLDKFASIFAQDPNFFSKSNCRFPGASTFKLMQEFEIVDKKVNDYLYDVTIHKAWQTDYNYRHNISSPYRINEGLQNYYSVMYSTKALLKMAISALSEVYDDFTVYEWIEQKIYPQLLRLETFYNNTVKLQKLRVWPKRPLKPLADLQRFMKTNNDNGYGD